MWQKLSEKRQDTSWGSCGAVSANICDFDLSQIGSSCKIWSEGGMR